MKKIAAMTAAAAMLGALAVPALALEDRYARVNVAPADWLSIPEVTQKLEEAGYQVTKIERDDGVYEIDAIKDGAKIDAHVHPATGEVLAWEHDD
jgi:ABC-type proline/glycine betaine transport system substrate-binding protein